MSPMMSCEKMNGFGGFLGTKYANICHASMSNIHDIYMTAFDRISASFERLNFNLIRCSTEAWSGTTKSS